MRFLIDNSASPRLAVALIAAGHDAAHIRDIGRSDMPDDAIFELAAQDDRVIVALDTDFGTLLAKRTASRPSVILVRRQGRSTEALLAMLLANLSAIEADLLTGAIVVFEDARIRIRRLPIG